jgi:hypothetical protein
MSCSLQETSGHSWTGQEHSDVLLPVNRRKCFKKVSKHGWKHSKRYSQPNEDVSEGGLFLVKLAFFLVESLQLGFCLIMLGECE